MHHDTTPLRRLASPESAALPPAPRRRASWAFAAGALAASACAAPDPPPPPAGDPDDAPVLDVAFEACGVLAGAPDDRAACATVAAPLARDDVGAPRDERTVELFVKRVSARDPARRRVFVLMGGPGQPASDGEGLAKAMADDDPGLEVVLADHRGTGASSKLVCPEQEAPASPAGGFVDDTEVAACAAALQAEWGDGLASFSATEAAWDVLDLARALHVQDRDDGREPPGTFLLGVSYGTYLANRVLQAQDLRPRATDDGAGGDGAGEGVVRGVVFDSMCPPGTCTFEHADAIEDGVAEEIFALCGDDPDCAPRFSDENGDVDAWAAVADLFASIDAGHCTLTETPAEMRDLVRTLLGTMMNDAGLRRAAPAVVKRLTRCEEDDQQEVAHLLELLFGPPDAPQSFGGFSFLLANNIAYSEMWDRAADPAAVRAETQSLFSARGVGAQIAGGAPLWPKYDDALAGIVADSDVPLVILNAEYDPVTPAFYAEEYAAHFGGDAQHLVILQGAAHGTLGQGAAPALGNRTCGFTIALAFMQDPTGPLDTSCDALTIPLAFSGGPQFATALFGVPDFWGDAP